jgi:hypothetical protein
LAKLAIRCYDALSPDDVPTAASLVDDFVKGETTRLNHMLATARLTAFTLQQERAKETKAMEEETDDDAASFEPESGEEHEDIYMNESEEDDFEVDDGIMLIRGREALDPATGV